MSVSPQFRSRRRWLLWLGALACTVAVVSLVTRRAPRPTALPEVLRGQLTLREGQLYPTGSSVPFTGVVTESYPSGTPKSRSVVSNGLLEGLSAGWHTNGQQQIAEHFHAGVSHGARTKWYPAGQKLSEVMIVQGKLDGVFRRWHTNGVLAEEIPMTRGEPDGLSHAFYPSGCLQAEARLQAGKVLERHHWNDGERPAATVAQAAEPPAAAQ